MSWEQEVKSQRKKELQIPLQYNASLLFRHKITGMHCTNYLTLPKIWHIYLLQRLAVSGTRLVEWHNRRIYGTWDCKSTITDSNHQTCIRVVQPTPLHTPGMPTSACNCMTIVPVPEMTGTNTRIWQCAKVQNSNKDFWSASWPFHSRAIPFEIIWKVQNSHKDFLSASWPFHSRAIRFEIIWILDAIKLGNGQVLKCS